MEDTIAEKLLTIAENEQNVFNAGYEKGLASGGVTINNQDKTITENGVYQADEGYTGLGTVTVEVASTGGGDIDALIDRSITEITSNVESIGDGAFSNCNLLTIVNFPLATNISSNAFSSCGKLKTVDLPSAVSISTSAFDSCLALKTVDFPLVKNISNNAFNSCLALETVDLSLVKSIGSGSFMGCKALSSLIIRSETICTLITTFAFNSSSIASGTGYIYVPKDLVESYKSATNWSTYATQFRALEDYTVDGTINGELDESKI